MKEGPDISHIAALIGDPARANILVALMSGAALTAGELAREAGVSAQTASSHLAKLHAGGLIEIRKQGRRKYAALAKNGVAQTLEGLMNLAANTGKLRARPGPKDAQMRYARACYNHLAGEMGVRLFESCQLRGHFEPPSGDTNILGLTPKGAAFAQELGVDLSALRKSKTPLCRACLDWSERRSHLAGSLGRAYLRRFEELGWIKRAEGSRVVQITALGREAFAQAFPL